MDFPKSVPGVGLVGGQFADEDPALGRQGSLIPSAWGNAITQELLNVIQAAGLEPSEEQTNQLLQAIRTLVPERSAFARVSGTLALPATAFGIYALDDGGAAATVTLPSTEDLVDDTELLLFANHANTATVQVKAVTGQTVQGPSALMGASTTAFMLPAGGDWVRLRSEKAQGRWVIVAHWSARRITKLEEDGGLLTITGNANLTGVDNKLVMGGIVQDLKLEKGDVVRIKVTAIAYNKLHTVESIADSGQIVLNYEHCAIRGNGPLKLPDYGGPVTIERIAKWHSASYGLGQDWVDLTALLVNGVNQQNSSGRTVGISIFSGNNIELSVSASMHLVIDGKIVTGWDVMKTNTPSDGNLFSELPNGCTYKYQSSGYPNGTYSVWQLR